MVLSTVTSSDLWTASLHDLYPSVFPMRDVVADSELTSVGKGGLRTSTERATWSRLQASMLCEQKTNSRCKKKKNPCKKHRNKIDLQRMVRLKWSCKFENSKELKLNECIRELLQTKVVKITNCHDFTSQHVSNMQNSNKTSGTSKIKQGLSIIDKLSQNHAKSQVHYWFYEFNGIINTPPINSTLDTSFHMIISVIMEASLLIKVLRKLVLLNVKLRNFKCPPPDFNFFTVILCKNEWLLTHWSFLFLYLSFLW